MSDVKLHDWNELAEGALRRFLAKPARPFKRRPIQRVRWLDDMMKEKRMSDAKIPSWALRAADDFHGAQSIDLDLAALLAKRASAALMDLTPMQREQEIVAIIAKEKA